MTACLNQHRTNVLSKVAPLRPAALVPRGAANCHPSLCAPPCPAAFAGMDDAQQQHHSALLPLMLSSGLHSAAAAHIRACLVRMGLQPG